MILRRLEEDDEEEEMTENGWKQEEVWGKGWAVNLRKPRG